MSTITELYFADLSSLFSYDISINLLDEFLAVCGEASLISQQVGLVFNLFTPLSLGYGDLSNDFILTIVVEEVCIIERRLVEAIVEEGIS